VRYKESHPWIRFQLKVSTGDHHLWLQLGEIASKCEHLSGVPLKPDFAAELHKVFLTKGVMATTAIEGNTLSEEQVRAQIDGKLQLPPSQEYLQREIQNILEVINQEISVQVAQPEEKKELCPGLLKRFNERILGGLEVDEEVVPGEYRGHSVLVGGNYRGAPAEDCAYLMERLCEWLGGPDFVAPQQELAIPFAVIRAVVAHVYLAWIHPFGDGNGRTARAMEFHLLFTSGLPLPASHLLSDHYNKTRSKYYRELDRASKSGGDLMPFIRYAVQGLLDGLREQIALVRAHQMEVAWENYVHQAFREKKTSPAQKRRRDLILALSTREWVEVEEVELITPKLAREYATAGDRMLQRDLNALAKLGLVERTFGKVRARREIIQAFLPVRIKST